MKRIYLSLITITLVIQSSNAQNKLPPAGNVGIGTEFPIAALDVGGLIQISALNTTSPSPDINYGLFPYNGVGLGIFSGDTGSNQGIGIWTSPGGIKHEVMRILSGGNVGIGTTSPSEKLSVNGNIRAREVKVETINWPDYVFQQNYELLKLSDVKTYIDKYHHLPDLPSAAQVEKEGINLGEINSKLLRKIEELTLHLIEKDSQIKEQEIRIKIQEENSVKQQNTLNNIMLKIGI